LAAGLEVLREDERTDAERIAAIGYCFGGTGVLELARSGAKIAGVVSFHGGLGAGDGHAAGKGMVPARVLVLHGADDPFVPLEEVSAFWKEMQEAGADWQIVTYPGAVHGFTQKMAGDDPSRGAAYNATADERSWSDMKEFFAAVFAK
jgi:dienelactone hydrolase